MLAQNVFKVPESKMRVIAQDVGGGFGTKGWQYIEHRLTLWAAKKLLRPVKWTCERSEAVMADEHGRDNVGEIELALDKDNKFVALRLNMLANIGAYVGSDRNLLSPFGMIGTVLGVYRIPTAYINVVGVLSNTNPTAPYRGAGRPEAIYLIERLIDDGARELGIDRIELRRKNMLPEAALPYQSPVGPFYDCGKFEENMDMALKLADVAGFEARKAELEEAGPVARPRHRQCHRAGGRPRAAGICRDPLQPQRHRRAPDGHQGAGPGSRDHVQADPARAARHRSQRGAVH